MNLLEQVTKCQNYIMFTQLHQNKSKITSRSKTSQTGRISELEGEKLGQKPLCAVQISVCIALLWCWFWGTCQSQNWAQVGLLESPARLLSNPSGIFQFGVHLPLQKCILPRLLPVCPKRGSEVIFCMFFDLLGTQTLMKCLGHSWACIFHQKKSKNANHLWFGSPNRMGRAWRATRWVKKPVLGQNFQNWQNLLQISWNLDWRFFIKGNDEPRMPQTISRVLHPLFASLKLSLPLLSNSRFSLCTLSSGTSNDMFATSMKPHECMSFQGWVTLGFHFIIGWMIGWHNCCCTTALEK